MKSLVTILLLQILAFSALAAEETHLLGVKSEEKAGKTYVQFQLSKSVALGNIEARFLRRTVEWDLKGVQLKKDKIFQNIGTSQISNVYVSQSDATTSRIRVNLQAGSTASDYSERVSFSRSGSTLTMVMDPSAAFAANTPKEMSKVYPVAESAEAKYTEQLAATQTLKVGSNTTSAAIETVTPVAEATAPMATGADEDVVLSTESIENKSESEIPLNVKKAESKALGSGSASRVAIGFGVIALLAFSAVMVGKKINRKRLSAPFSHDSIKVISQKYLGPKRNLTMVRVAGEYMLLGVTDNNITLIKTLSIVDDEIPELSPSDFGTAMKNLTSKTTNKKALSSKSQAVDDLTEEVEDSFSVSSLSDVKNIMKQRKYIDEVDF
jgi:flagellar protein FliO/FliZ